MTVEQAFGETVRKLRKERHLSQEQLGFESGIHRTHISFIERGVKSPTLHVIWALSRILNTTPSDMMRAVEKQSPRVGE